MKTRILQTFLITFLVCLGISAQDKATVESFTTTTDHIPAGDRVKDLNGDPCALVKVFVVDEIERIEGNVIGNVINKGVEKWVYICKGSRNMRIHLKNHLPVKVSFPDYKINGLESNRVYELVLKTPNQSQREISSDVRGGYLQMKVYPINTVVTIWGENYSKQSFRPQDDGTIRVYLTYGRYHYSASANGFNDSEGSVFVNDEERWNDIRLQALTGNLIVACNTKGVEYYLNGQILSRVKNFTSWTESLVPGQYQLEARKKGFVTKIQTVSISANETIHVNFENLLSVNEEKKVEKEKIKNQKKSLAQEEKNKQKAKKAELAKQKKEKRKLIREQNEKKACFIGIDAGYNLASVQFDSKYGGDIKPMSGFFAGLTADFRLVKSFWLSTGLQYSMKGYKYENWRNDIKEEGNAHYVEIPLLASLRFPLGSQVKLVLNAGPYAALCAGGKVKDKWGGYYDESFSSAYSSVDYGLQVGIGADIAYNFYIGVSYQLGMESKYQNRNLMFGIGYRF